MRQNRALLSTACHVDMIKINHSVILLLLFEKRKEPDKRVDVLHICELL